MNKIYFYFLSVIIIIYTSCQVDNKSIVPDLFITFKVDSIKIYEGKNIPKDIFIFSPLGHKDKIWTANVTNPYELDLVTGVWSPLSRRFGNKKALHLDSKSIWKDNFTNVIYIGDFGNGLFRYYQEKDTFDFLGIHPVTALYPREKNIVIGTANGLYFLNRHDNKINVANNFPLDIWVTSIKELINDTLSINYKYYYHISSNTFGDKITYDYLPTPKANYDYVSPEVKSKLPNGGGGFHEFRSNGIYWYYDDSELYYSKNNIDFFKFPIFPKGHVRHLLDDTDYLYVLYDDIFVIFNKEYLFKKSVIHEVLNYEKLQKEFLFKRTELNSTDMEFDEYLTKSIVLYNDKRYSTHFDLEDIPSNFEFYNFEKGVKNLNSILKNDTIPDIFKYKILAGLCRKYTTSAKLDSALIFFQLIKDLYPFQDKNCIKSSYPCVVIAKNKIDSINNQRIDPAKVLYLEAKTLTNLIECSCWFGESWLDYSIVEEKYRKLLTNFPSSKYADDAEYWLIKYNYFDGEGSGYPISEIPKIKKFISKNPNFDFIPELIMDIAYSYSVDDSENIDDKINSMEKAIRELVILKKKYQLDSNQLANVDGDLNRYEHEKNKLIYTLNIVPMKTAFKIDEDIEVEIIIANNSSTPKTLELYSNASYVSFSILPEKKVKFIPIDMDDNNKKTITIAKGAPIKQKVKLNRLVHHWDGVTLGRFNFEEEGLYYLSFHSKENYLDSPQFKIYVKF